MHTPYCISRNIASLNLPSHTNFLELTNGANTNLRLAAGESLIVIANADAQATTSITIQLVTIEGRAYNIPIPVNGSATKITMSENIVLINQTKTGAGTTRVVCWREPAEPQTVPSFEPR